MVHVPLMFLSEWLEFPSAPCLARKKNLMTALVSMLLKSRSSLDILLFSLCTKKGLAIRHMNRPLFPTTLSIPSYDIFKYVELRTYQHLLVFSKYTEISNFINSVQWEPSCSMRTDMMKVIVTFRSFAKAPPTMAHEFEYIWNVCNVWLGLKKMKPVLCLEFQNIRMRQISSPIQIIRCTGFGTESK